MQLQLIRDAVPHVVIIAETPAIYLDAIVESLVDRDCFWCSERMTYVF